MSSSNGNKRHHGSFTLELSGISLESVITTLEPVQNMLVTTDFCSCSVTYMSAAVVFIILASNRSLGVLLLNMVTACDAAGSAGEKCKVWKAFGETVGCRLVACWCDVEKCIHDLADLAVPMLVRMSGNILSVIKAIRAQRSTVPSCRDWFPPPVFRSQRGRRNALFLRGDNSFQGRFYSQWSDEFSHGFWLQMNHTTLPNSMSLLLYLHKEFRLLMDCQCALEWKLPDWLCIIWANTICWWTLFPLVLMSAFPLQRFLSV